MPELIPALCTLFGTAATLMGGLWAVFQLTLISRDKRSEWLWRLNQEFYKDTEFEAIRELLDAGEGVVLTQVGFDRFLNFLETVAILGDTGQLPRKYASALFGYWVERLYTPGTRNYLKKYRYGHLLAWVERRKYYAPRARKSPKEST